MASDIQTSLWYSSRSEKINSLKGFVPLELQGNYFLGMLVI